VLLSEPSPTLSNVTLAKGKVQWIALTRPIATSIPGGPATMATLAEAFSWRVGFWVLSLAPMLAAAGCYRVIMPDPPVPATPFHFHATLSGYRGILDDRRS
jgi:hypothetical protein